MTQRFSDDNFTQPDGADASRPAHASAPEGNLEAAFATIGGKKVRGATPKPAESVEPNPETFAKLGGKFLGKMPAATPASEPSAATAAAQPTFDRVHDHAFDILSAAADMNDDQRADAWSHYHDAKDSKDLAQRLGTADAPNKIKHQLFVAKQTNDPVPSHADKVIGAITRMAAMDKNVLAVAESHPAILRLLTGKE